MRLCMSAPAEEPLHRREVDLCTWMSDLPPAARKLPLHRLAIPGSHNSFTYSLNKSSEVGPDTDRWLQDLARRFGFIAKPIIYNWSVCQGLTCLEQLRAGVRYLDFRLGKECPKKAKRSRKRKDLYREEKKAEIRLLHGLYGLRVEEALSDVQVFLADHPGEVVILDFQHLYGLDERDASYVTRLVLKTFHRRLCPPMPDVSLEEMRASGYQVIAVNKLDSSASEEPFWPRTLCPNPWANTTNVSSLSDFLDDGLRERGSVGLFVSQAILTPDGDTVMLHLFSTLKTCLADKCNKFVTARWLPKVAVETGVRANIVMVDFITDSIARPIVGLNFRAESSSCKQQLLLTYYQRQNKLPR